MACIIGNIVAFEILEYNSRLGTGKEQFVFGLRHEIA
jgi:hypothetical protein